ncbi:MAG: SDR family NAD(P)-dependent oxidoreductase, partial [candidate division WOR-3 bacterium]
MKVAIITGATSGIGLATARVLKREGWNLSLVGRNTEKIQLEFPEDLIIKADVSDYKSAEEIVNKTVERFGRLDALINNAGQTLDKPLIRLSPEELENIFRVNLFSAFMLTKSALKYLKGGVVVNVSSVVGIVGNAWQTSYAATKAGLIAFTKSLAKEMGSRNIRVVAVAPGYIETPMTEGLPEEVKKKYLES